MRARLLASAAALAAAVAVSPALAEPNDHPDKGAAQNSAGDTGRHDGGVRGADAARGSDADRGTPSANHDRTVGTNNGQAMGSNDDQAMGGDNRHRGYNKPGAAILSGDNNTAVRPRTGESRTATGARPWQTVRGGDDRGGGRTNVFLGRGSHWGQRVHNNAFASLRRAFSAPRRYHAGAFYQPAGWRYQRWTVGAFLPALYFSQNYWLQDYNSYGLTPPPDGTEWVRYGDDALLIDQDTGEVIQVVYGIFY